MTNILYHQKFSGFCYEIYSDRPEFDFTEVDQVHSSIVVSEKDARHKTIKADGMYAPLPLKYSMAIKTADCLPIIAIGPSDIIFIHAGWKGLSEGIIENNQIADIVPYHFVIGPHINECCFEVTKGFEDNFEKGESYSTQRDNKYYFSLTSVAKTKIKEKYPNAKIEINPTCTMCDTRYNSYRRDKTKIRNYNVLRTL